MKIINSVLTFAMVFPVSAFADVPAGAPGKLSDPKWWGRCNPNGAALNPEGCAAITKASFASGCLNQTEYDFAIAHNAVVGCVGTEIFSACVCGCFEANTRVLTLDAQELPQWTNVSEIKRDSKIISVGKFATLENLSFEKSTVSHNTSGPEDSAMYIFNTTAGSLSVTQNHAILLANGELVAAKDVKLTDALVAANGLTAELVSIERKATKLPVYNFQVTNVKSDKEHLIVAEGLIVGDLYLQNRILRTKNSVLSRK